jgi:hypothetical protein
MHDAQPTAEEYSIRNMLANDADNLTDIVLPVNV